MKNIAIIPARIGSKRIPKKNIKNFLGKPIISYPIEAALKSKIFDEVIVSTDSKEVQEMSKNLGANSPKLRPKNLSDDFTPTAPVLDHALKHLASIDLSKIDFLCCIYPTSVFVTSNKLKEAFKKIKHSKSGSCFGVIENDHPIMRSQRINEKGHLELIWPEHELTRSQDLEKTFRDSGQFYFLNCKRFLYEKKIYYEDSLPITLTKYEAHDIDTIDDWAFSEFLYKQLSRNK